MKNYFGNSEFTNSTVAKQNGIRNNPDAATWGRIYLLRDNVLNPAREAYGAPIYITSGYRCPQLNAAVGGAATSQHTKGEAADVKADDPLALAQLVHDLGLPYDQMILYPTFVHISHKLGGPQRKRILYNKSYKGEHVKIDKA